MELTEDGIDGRGRGGVGVGTVRPSVVVTSDAGWHSGGLRELWNHREVLWILAVRDIKVRYKQTAIGVAWAVLQPVTTMLVFAVLFRALLSGGSLPSTTGVPYAISTCTGLAAWNLFAISLSQSSLSLVANRSLVTKVYFPRLLLPAVPIVAALVDFLIGMGVVAALILGYLLFGHGYTFHPGWPILTLPFFVALAVATALACGIWLAAMNAVYRDVKYVIPFLTQALMLLTPVVYDAGRITVHLPPWARTLYSLNPMVGVVEGFRWALFGATAAPGLPIVLSLLGVSALLVGGMAYFRRMERVVADLV